MEGTTADSLDTNAIGNYGGRILLMEQYVAKYLQKSKCGVYVAVGAMWTLISYNY